MLELENSLSSSSMQMQAHLQLLTSLIWICQDRVCLVSLAIQAEGVSLPYICSASCESDLCRKRVIHRMKVACRRKETGGWSHGAGRPWHCVH